MRTRIASMSAVESNAAPTASELLSIPVYGGPESSGFPGDCRLAGSGDGRHRGGSLRGIWRAASRPRRAGGSWVAQSSVMTPLYAQRGCAQFVGYTLRPRSAGAERYVGNRWLGRLELAVAQTRQRRAPVPFMQSVGDRAGRPVASQAREIACGPAGFVVLDAESHDHQKV